MEFAYNKRYEDPQMQAAYENACDCLYFGMGSKCWNDCGIPQERRKEVWGVAWYDLGDGCDSPIRPIPEIVKEIYG